MIRSKNIRGKKRKPSRARKVSAPSVAETGKSPRPDPKVVKAIIDRAYDGVCVCHNIAKYPFVRFSIWNDRMTKLTGYTMEEINRLGWYQSMYPDQELRQKAIARMERMREGDDLVSEEWTITRADGKKRVFFISTCVLYTVKNQTHVLAFMRDVTDSRQAEKMLRESEEKYRALINNAGEAILLVDFQGNFVGANKKAQELVGYSEKELLNMNIARLHPRQEVERVIASFKKHMREGSGRLNNTLILRKDGREVPVDFTGTVISYAGKKIMQGIIEEVLERQRVEASESRLRLLADNMTDLIGQTDVRGVILYASPSHKAVVGYAPEELTGKLLPDFVHPEDRERALRVVLAAFKNRSPASVEFRFRHKDGRYIWLGVTGRFLFNEKGFAETGIYSARDIAGQRRMQQEMEKAEKLESLGILAGGIAHDFNNILMAIIGNISFIRAKGQFSGKISESLADAEGAVFRARDLVQQLLTFSKGGAPLKQAVDMRGLIRDSAAFVLSGSKAKCRFSIPDDLWPAEVDQSQISQVINNMVLNAGQAMPEGGVIEIKARNIVLPSGDKPSIPLPSGRYVTISIKDSGEGIPMENMSKLFDPFFTTKQKGTGLGLSICYSIISRHNGFIDVESKPGAGTIFSIYLPASERLPEAGTKTAAAPVLAGRSRILLMDDDEDVLSAASQMIEMLGFEITLARDGAEAIELYQRAKQDNNPFAAVIMDLTVPGGMGGKEAIARLLKLDPQVRAVVSSGYSTDAVISDYEQYGFKAAIIKPYNLQNLKEVLSTVISGKG